MKPPIGSLLWVCITHRPLPDGSQRHQHRCHIAPGGCGYCQVTWWDGTVQVLPRGWFRRANPIVAEWQGRPCEAVTVAGKLAMVRFLDGEERWVLARMVAPIGVQNVAK